MTRLLIHVIATPSGLGGAERVMAAVATRAADRNWDQIVVNPFQAGRRTVVTDVLEGIPYVSTVDVGRVDRAAAWLGRQLRARPPAVVQAYMPKAAWCLAAVRRGAEVRTLSHQYGDHFHRTRRPHLELLDACVVRRFDRTVACSAATADYLNGRLRLPRQRIAVIRNGWEGTPLPHIGGGERPTVVCVANFRPQKNHDGLLRAFSHVVKALPSARLVLVGDGEGAARIHSLIADLGLGDSVEHRSGVTDVWPVLSRADVMAMPSLYEPLGISALEGSAAGLPIVASDVGGLPEIVRHGETGVLVEPQDLEGWVRAMTTLLTDSAERRRLGTAGQRLASEHHMHEAVASYLDLFEDLASARRA